MVETKKTMYTISWQYITVCLLKKWYLLLLAALIGAAIGYIKLRTIKPVYTASFSFVLSTDQRGNGGFANLAAQLGFDAITSSPDNIFSGDNIIELFKSRRLIGAALQSRIDSPSHQTLLNLIAQKEFTRQYNTVGAFEANQQKYSVAQKRLYRNIVAKVGKSFIVFKKDKKLIVFILSANSSNPDIAYYTAKFLLDETAKYFIETKTKVSVNSVKLLQHEADSLAGVLSKTFNSTASMNDRTYNINPSVSIQRSGAMFNQAKAAAYTAAYTEVMRNLEIAKINLQKETPLYRIIDEPELPLLPVKVSALKHVLVTAAIGFITMLILITAGTIHKKAN